MEVILGEPRELTYWGGRMRLVAVRWIMFVLCLLPAGLAWAQTFGNWAVRREGQSHYAVAGNDSGHELGIYCPYQDGKEGKCYWLVGISISCKEGAKYPVLVSNAEGAEALEMHCLGRSDASSAYQYVFSNFAKIDSIVRKESRVGIALALDGGRFLVVRFDVARADAALDALRDAVNKIRPVRGTKDEKL